MTQICKGCSHAVEEEPHDTAVSALVSAGRSVQSAEPRSCLNVVVPLFQLRFQVY